MRKKLTVSQHNCRIASFLINQIHLNNVTKIPDKGQNISFLFLSQGVKILCLTRINMDILENEIDLIKLIYQIYFFMFYFRKLETGRLKSMVAYSCQHVHFDFISLCLLVTSLCWLDFSMLTYLIHLLENKSEKGVFALLEPELSDKLT